MPQPSAVAMPAAELTEAVAGSREAFLSDTVVAKLSPAFKPGLTIPFHRDVRFLITVRYPHARTCSTCLSTPSTFPGTSNSSLQHGWPLPGVRLQDLPRTSYEYLYGPSRRDSQLPGSSVDAQMLATLSLYKFAPSKRDELKPGDLKPAAQEFDALAPVPQGGRWSPYRAMTVHVSGTWLNA
ncbi:hypothetical protein CCMA1212_001470 [Trichoderma ghanense]|uniref:Uncharacterized protein n=1 Tax=Trichoderma ghanense TaxID=65468 RepID=A0ABY2HDN1_9HYPO